MKVIAEELRNLPEQLRRLPGQLRNLPKKTHDLFNEDLGESKEVLDRRKAIRIILLVTVIVASAIGYNYLAESAQKKQTEPKGSDAPSLVVKV